MTVLVYRSRSASFAAKRVAAAAPARGGGIRVVQQDIYRHQDGDTAVVRWDCYTGLVRPPEVVDVNPWLAVTQSRNKAESRRILAELAPPTWFARPDVQVPCVIRPRQHKAGQRFHVIREASNILRAVKRCGIGWYASQLIDKIREFRVFVVQGRVVAVSERFPASPTDVAWNLARGGRLINVAQKYWPVQVLRASLQAMEKLDLGFGAVDVALDTSGHVFVFEVNTSPALRNKFTIKQLAKGLASCSSVALPPVKDRARKPQSFLHPALLKERS